MPEYTLVLHGLESRSRRVRVAGRIDAIRHSDRAFMLVLESGEPIHSVLATGDTRELIGHVGRIAVVSGLAHFHPSGALHRIDADAVESGGEAELAMWSAKPRPLFAEMDVRELHRPQGPRSGLNALIGMWPGDETAEELFSRVDEIS